MFHSGHFICEIFSSLCWSPATWCFMLTVGPACPPLSPWLLYHNDHHQHQSSVIIWSTGTLTLPDWGPGENWVWASPPPPLWHHSGTTSTTTDRASGGHSDLAAQHNYAKNVWLYQCPGSLGPSQLISQDVPSPHLTSPPPRTSVSTYGVSSTSNVTI